MGKLLAVGWQLTVQYLDQLYVLVFPYNLAITCHNITDKVLGVMKKTKYRNKFIVF